MGKLLSWVALIALAWLVLELVAISRRRRERSRFGSATDGARVDASAANRAERIVPCAHCGLFLPASDALRDGDSAYCSRAHLDAHRARQRAPQRGE